MKTLPNLAKFFLAVLLGLVLLSPKAEATATDQVAIQLGALQLGINLSSNSTTDQQRAQALVQGRAVLGSTTRRAQVGVQGFAISPTSIQTETLRNQILQATQAALATPANFTLSRVPVNLSNNRTVAVTATLNPARTTASLIFQVAAARIPNYSPLLVSDAINAAFAKTSSGAYVFAYRNEAAMIADVNRVGGAAMVTGMRAYARGTVNWAPVPTTGTGNGTFLPNFSSRPIQPRSPSPQAPDLAGLANAAGAIAAQASSALNANLGQLSSGTNSVAAMTQLATSLVKSAAAFQRTSTAIGTGLTPLIGGSVAGAGFGQVITLADTTSDLWSAQVNSTIMNGIVAGGIKGGGAANAYAFAWGVATGYVAAYYLANGSQAQDITTFRTNNVSILLSQFTANRVRTSGTFPSLFGRTVVTLETVLEAAFNAAHDAYLDPTNPTSGWGTIAGANGLQLPGVPTPVTDTVGL